MLQSLRLRVDIGDALAALRRAFLVRLRHSRFDSDDPRQTPLGAALVLSLGLLLWGGCSGQSPLLRPQAPVLNLRAPEIFQVRLETSRGPILIEVHRDWSPHGADRFYNLVRAGYYDEARFFRVIAGKWAQFGINGDPRVARLWRTQTIPDDPRVQSNTRGTLAYAFAVPNGRTTQVFINLRDNSATHDALQFVPFGRIVAGMEVADALNTEYGERAGGGIRGGKQDSLFEDGNHYLNLHFPRLDYIKRASLLATGPSRNNSTEPPIDTDEYR